MYRNERLLTYRFVWKCHETFCVKFCEHLERDTAQRYSPWIHEEFEFHKFEVNKLFDLVPE